MEIIDGRAESVPENQVTLNVLKSSFSTISRDAYWFKAVFLKVWTPRVRPFIKPIAEVGGIFMDRSMIPEIDLYDFSIVNGKNTHENQGLRKWANERPILGP